MAFSNWINDEVANNWKMFVESRGTRDFPCSHAIMCLKRKKFRLSGFNKLLMQAKKIV